MTGPLPNIRPLEGRNGAGDARRLDDLEPIGIIDIGSNSVRLVVYDGAVRAPTPLFNEKDSCRLGRSIHSTGKLDGESVESALETLTRFRAIARVLRVKNMRAFATAAAREASNGREFLARGEQALGSPITLLTGEREAELAALGINMGFGPLTDGVTGDLGGGSLELVDVTAAGRRNAMTLPLGGLRLIDVTGGRIEKAMIGVEAELQRCAWANAGKGRPFYAVGGAWRALAKLHMTATDYPLGVLHGYSVPARDMVKFCESLRKGKKVKGLDDVARGRRDVLPYGALVLERVVERLQSSEVVFSVFGIREGALFDLLPLTERRKDPLLTFCEDYARLRSRSLRHAQELCDWTDTLFAAIDPRESVEERRLRHAACLLSDIGWRINPDFRGEQSLSVIAHSAMAGIDHPGRVFLALTVYLRHAGPFAPLEGLGGRLAALAALIDRDKRAVKRARQLAAAIRTAHMLSMGYSGIIDEAPICVEKTGVVLTIPRPHAQLDGERFRRRFEVLAKLCGLDPIVRIAV
jgi:exopolyphosphatase / guanosine-5'-triphosphate,3'-diphosphate pyrophosphatase